MMVFFGKTGRWLLGSLMMIGSWQAAPAADLESTDLGKFIFTCLEIRDVMRGAGLAVMMETPGGITLSLP